VTLACETSFFIFTVSFSQRIWDRFEIYIYGEREREQTNEIAMTRNKQNKTS
jgi:hypothetical protein